jgi:multiple sugar transport system substrate-binding protein
VRAGPLNDEHKEILSMIHSKPRRAVALRRAAAIVAAGALISGLAACSSGTPSSAGQTASVKAGSTGTDDGTKLTLWTRAPLEKQAKLLVAAYNESHKNQVALTVVPNDDYVAKVGAAAGSGSLPDLFAADIVYVPNFVKQGLFQDISANIDALDYKDEINKGHLAAGTADGKEHVLPFVLDLSVMMWNKDLFKEAGLDPDKAPATLGEFAEDAKKVQALGKAGTYGTATGLNCGGCEVFTWFPSIWADGERVMNEEGTEANFTSDSAKSVFSTWRDLWRSGAVLPSSKNEAGPTWTAGFTDGKVGIMPYPATLLSSTTGFDVGVAGLPGTKGGESTFVGGDGIGISKDSKKASAAWNFLSWLMSEKAQVDVLAKDNDVVSRGDLASNTYSEKDPRLVKINEVAAKGQTPYSLNFQQAYNAPGSPWLTLLRDQVLGSGGDPEKDNAAITAVLGQ